MKEAVCVFWFRRDLRLDDNAGLARALESGLPVLPIFIFDTTILNQLEEKRDRRVDYIHQALCAINQTLQKHQATLQTFVGTPQEVFQQLISEYTIHSVYCNRDYEPQAIDRDASISKLLAEQGIYFHSEKDQVIFEASEVVKQDGGPYTVYTPYANKWREQLQSLAYTELKVDLNGFLQMAFSEVLSLETLGFQKTDVLFSPPVLDEVLIANYDQTRDFPALRGTTQLGMALRFGTISIRSAVAFGLKHSETWLKELIWREFFMQILFHFPRVVSESFKRKYDAIVWRNDEAEFERWCSGTTGYPLVDAGMRELNETGFMHNRVRMVVASFLCKHLLIDWRWGEAYFAQKLNDYDLAANNGNWQWAAGCGCDAAPYFRVFNPELQMQKFDKHLEYIRKWVPEWGTAAYLEPMVEHAFARKRALEVYGKGLN